MRVILAPFEFEFFRKGLLVAMLAGALCGFVGVYVVLRKMSYIGHGLSHAIFGGAAASSVLSISYYVGAGIWGIASALLIGRVARRKKAIGSDAAIGVVTTASFALGLALFATFGTARKSVEAALFGSILGVSGVDIMLLVGMFALTVIVVFGNYRTLLFSTFDPDVAQASGVRTARVDALFMIVLAGSILVTMKVIGVLLIAALLVIPPAVARMMTDSFARMLGLSTCIGALCGFVGLYLSYYLDVSSGASVVLVGAALFVVTYLATGRRTSVTMRTA